MIDHAKELARSYTQEFAFIHSNDPKIAYTCLVSTFITCYGMMETDDRRNAMAAIMMMAKDICQERFEDGNDFLSFLKQKVEDRIEKGDLQI